MSTEDKKWLYGRLGLDLNYDEFEETLSNDDDMQWYYDRARNMGLEVGTYDEFNELFGNPVQVQPTDSTYKVSQGRFGALVNEETPEEKAERKAIRQIKTADKIAKIGQFMSPVSSPSTFAPTPIVKESEPKLPTPEQIVAAEDERLFKQHLKDSGQIQDLYNLRDYARENDGSNGIWDYINPLGEKAPIGGAIHLLRSAFSEDYRDKKRAQRRNRLIAEQADKAIDVYEQATGDRNGISSVFNAIADEASRISTWDLGMTDLQNAATLYDLSQKDESELTASEKATLDVIGLASSVMDLYGDEVGIGYTLGRGIPATISFMGSMALNPAAGYGKKLAGDAVKKFGKDYVKRVAKRAAGDILETGAYVGSVALPQVAANTLDRINGSTTYDLDDDLNVVYGGQEDQETLGNAIWKAFGETFIEGYTERVGDYFDPIIGFAKGVTKGIKAGKLSDFAEALVEVKPTATMQNIRRFKEKTLFNGTLSELMEEELGMIMNAYTVGDYTFDKEEAERTGKTYILDPVNQFVTGMSVGMFSAAINGTEMAANHAYKRKVNKVAEKYGKIAERELGAQFSEMIDGVPSLRERIDNADADEKYRIFVDILGNPNLNDKQKVAVAKYAIYRQYAQTFNAVQANALNHKMNEVKEQHAAYEAGYSSALPAFYNIANAFKEADQAVEDYTARTGKSDVKDAILLIENNPSEIKNIKDGLTDEQYQLVTNYKNTLERYRGAYQGRSDKLEDYMDEVAFVLEPAINADTNGNRTITTAIYKDEPVYVTYNDGTNATIMRFNGEKLGDKTPLLTRGLSEIVSYDAEQYINDYRQQITGQMDAETENAFEHHPKTQAPQKDLVLQSPEGEVVITAVNDNMVEIVPAVYKDGQVQPKEGAEPRTITVDDAYAWQDDYYLSMDADQAYANAMAEANNVSAETAENEGTPSEQIEQSASEEVTDGQNGYVGRSMTQEEADAFIPQMVQMAEPSVDLEFTPENWIAEFGEDGVVPTPVGNVKMGENQYFKLSQKKRTAYFGMVKPTLTNPDLILEEYDPKDGSERDTKLIFVKTFVKPDGSRTVNFESVTVKKGDLEVSVSSHEIDNDQLLKKVQQDKLLHLNEKFSSSELRLTEPQQEGSDLVPTPNSISSNHKGSGNVSDAQANGQESVGEAANIDAGINKTARERVPKDDKGNPIYEQTDADTAWDAIVEETEGDTEMAQRVAVDMLEDKKAALAKLQNGKPKKGATVAEKIANEKAHQAAIAQAQNDVAQWEAIVGTEARRREAAMSEAARYVAEMERKSINEGLKALGEPQSLHEYVLGQLAGGAYKLRWSDKENGTKGFGSHTGLSTEEMKARLSMIDNKNGLTPEEVAHSIVENMDASFGEADVMDVTNMVIDAVSTHASRRSMLNGVVESRAELLRQQARAEQEVKYAWYMEQYHATEEELAAYNEYLAEFDEEIYGEDTDYEQRIATFAEIQLGEYDSQGTDADLRSSANQGEGLASDREGGRSVGETEQLDRRELREDAAGVAEAEDSRAGSSVSTQSDDRQSRIDRAIADYRENVDDSPEAIAAAERDQQRYEADMADDARINENQDDTARRSIQESPAEADRVSGEIFGRESLGEGESVSARSDGGILEEGAGKKKRTAKARRQSDNRQEANDGKAERLSRGISPVQQQAIDEYTRTNPWDANLTDDERGVLNMYRMATLNELDDLAHKLADKINSGKATPRDRMRYDVLAAYAKSGELKAVADAMGVEYDSPVSLDTIKSLFETFNSDPELAVLFNRVFPLIKEINPAIVYRRFTDADLEEGEDVSPDDILGQYSLQDNLIEYNRNQIDSNHCTEQEKASTIVHEMIHAVARYAIRVQEARNEGVELDIQLPKRLLDAAQSLIEVYDAIKDNEIFNDDRYESGKMYGVSSVHEMLSELANPEFREKLKQVSIGSLPSDKKGRVRDALRAIKDFLHRMFGWDSSSAYARTKRALDKLIDNYDSAGYNKAMELSDDDFAQQIRPSSEDNLRFRDGAPFFSNAERAVENIKQNKATPEQWLAMIKKDGGLKVGEDKWMGLSDWLNEQKTQGVKSMTKDEVLAFIRENQIEIEEVEYSDNPIGFDELKEEYEAMLRDEGYDAAHDAMVERFGDDFDIAFDDLGGELVTANEEAAAALLGSGNIINTTRLDYTTAGLENKREIALVVPTIEPWNQSDTIHFGDAGEGRAVAWVRFGETTDEDGNRVLVIDEVQSKRHDEGRAKGYSKHTKREEFRRLVDEMYDKYGANFHVKMTRDEEIEFDRLTNERIREDENNNSAVPDAPFDKNYYELVMKRMLRYAAENGFDKVAWTKGAQQAQRFGLADRVDSIKVAGGVDNIFTVIGRKDGGILVQKDVEGEHGLAELIGRDMARKAYSNLKEGKEDYLDENGAVLFEGEDLAIGGEGMKGFYDEMIPRFMNKYTKKWGTKVGEVTLPNVEEAGRTMWSVDVTDSMRESVMQGQPMFREGMGAISDREVSYENDPIAKFMGKPRYYGKRAAAFAERERRRMENAAKEAAEMLGIEAEIVTDASTLQGRKAKAKGWYDISNKKVVVVVPNHVSMGDAVRTVLHEGIAHHGLRELFGDGFDAMLDNVYNNVSPELKARIDAIAERTGVSTSVATEEYMASLAETTNFEEAQRRGWWQEIKSYFVDMLRKFAMPGLKLKEEITDNELRYLLWRSYKNLVEPNSYLRPLGYAEDVVKQKELKVGEYAEKAPATPMAADASEAEEWAAVTIQRIDELEAQAAQLENEIAEMEADRDADDASRYEMWEEQLDVLRKQMEDVYAELEGLYSLEAEAEEMSMAAEDGMLFSHQEIAQMKTPIYKSKGGFKNLAEAEVWAKENLQGQTRTNQFTGDEISIGKKSVSEMLNEKTLNQSVDVNTHLAALQSVLDFIETGIPAEVHKDTHGRDFDVMRLYNAIEVNGKVYRVKSTVRKVRQGDKYYTYEVQKMELIEERGANPNREGENPRNGNNSTNSISGAKLLKGVKKTNSNEEILPSDENIRNDAEIIAEVERESANLGVQVRIARSIDELPDEDTRKRAEDGKLKGYFDPRTGEVVLYEPNTENANDAKRTILHEIVGHKGLRRLIGEQQYDKAMLQLMYMLPADVRDAVLRRAERHGWNAAIAMDEYLADQAERDVRPTWWGKVNAKIRALLRNLGFDVKLTDADVTYLLWRSRKKLQGDDLNDMAVNAILKQAARKSAEADAWNEQAFRDAEMRDFERNTLPSVRHRMGADTNDYEKAVRTFGFKQAEAWQDHMRSLLVFQQALAKASGKNISDFENAYMYENRMSSANLMEMEQYRHMVYNPLLKAIHEMEQMGASRESIINYLFAKSGLERNEVFARRDAKKHAEGDATKEQQLYDKYRQKDYAGLTALTRGDAQIAALVDDHSKKKTEYDRLEQNKKRGVAVSDADLKATKKEMDDARKAMITAIEAEAQRMVDEFEAKHNTDNLWDKIRNCTHTTLNISHDAGVMSDEVYNELWNQFQYYIPLRGFAETTAEDMYLYLGGNDSPYNAPIKTAYGRTSLADDPIATIGNMAESAIVEANRNRLKQRFLYMVERHNTDLASISDVWLEYDGVNDEWHTVFAQIPDDATPSEAKRLQQEFEDRMKLLAEQNPGKYTNASQQPNIPYRVVKKGDRQEHHVIVKRNGKDVVITINGNPRVAQAINGLTNPEQNNGPVQRIVNWVNRNLSANFTMRNPAFMVSNFVRDGFYTNSMVWVKENPAYARQYNKNWAICTAQIASLVKRYKRYEKGDTSALDMNNDMDRMFYEFMINGGETGYTVIKSVEDYKGLISGEMKKMEAGAMGTARRVADTIGNVVDTFGRWAEDTSRFAAYMTSRQLGRTITKSIWDAKEISVNFNKKGSGNRMMGKFEQGNRLNYVLSNMSQLGRNLYVFWNAGVQGLNNFKNAAKKSPAKFTAMEGTYFTLGVIVAAAFSGDDDEDDYYNLPEYVRRNNICFKIGKGKYATLPLPIEIRAIYGLGELAYSYLSGREGLTHGEAVTKTIQQITQVLPIDMMADGGGAMALVPSAAKPVVEVIHNVDWTGGPIYKEKTSWNKNDPTWTLAFKSTSPELVQMSRLVNEWTNKNTADGLERPYNRGWADSRYLNNPAVWEHIMEGYLGGMATMFNQTKKTLMMPFNEDLREVRNVPIASRFIKDAGKEGRSYAARNEYYDAKNIMDSWKNEMSKAKKEVLDESLTDEQRLKAAKLRSSLEQQYTEAAERWKVLDRQRKALEEAYKSDQSEDNRQALDDVMMQMATLVEAYRD